MASPINSWLMEFSSSSDSWRISGESPDSPVNSHRLLGNLRGSHSMNPLNEIHWMNHRSHANIFDSVSSLSVCFLRCSGCTCASADSTLLANESLWNRSCEPLNNSPYLLLCLRNTLSNTLIVELGEEIHMVSSLRLFQDSFSKKFLRISFSLRISSNHSNKTSSETLFRDAL